MGNIILTGSSNIGIGLWTSICVCFCKLFGVTSENYKKKQEMVLNTAKQELEEAFIKLGPNYALQDFRVSWIGGLSVSVSALAVKIDESKQSKLEYGELVNKMGASFYKEGNFDEAFHYFSLGEKYSNKARYNVALCYFHGTGVKQDINLATDMFAELASQGDEKSIEMIEYINKKSKADLSQ